MVRVNSARTFLASATAVRYLRYRMSVEELGLRRLLYRAHRPGGGILRGLSGGIEDDRPTPRVPSCRPYLLEDTHAFLGADNVACSPDVCPIAARRSSRTVAISAIRTGRRVYGALEQWVQRGYKSV